MSELTEPELNNLARWLGSQQVGARLSLLTNGLELMLVVERSNKQISIDVSRGQLVLETGLKDLERLLVLVGNELAHEHGVVLQSARLKVVSHRPRQVDLYLTATAKRGIFRATVDLKGRLTLNDDFEARLTSLDMRGQGLLGGMFAAWMRPQLKQIEGQSFAIASLVPGDLQIQDVRIEVDEQIRLVAVLDDSHLLLEKPTPMNALAANVNGRPAVRQVKGVKKLDIYLIDTGWNIRGKAILDSHLVLFEPFLADHNVYVLSDKQSKEVLKQHPLLMGTDPILMVVDSDQRIERPGAGYGFRFCLGTMPDDEECADALKRMLRIVAEGARTGGGRIVQGIKTELHREGMDGALQIIIDVVEATTSRR